MDSGDPSGDLARGLREDGARGPLVGSGTFLGNPLPATTPDLLKVPAEVLAAEFGVGERDVARPGRTTGPFRCR